MSFLKKIFKFLLGLLGFVLLAFVGIYFFTEYKFSQKFDVSVSNVPVIMTLEHVNRGKHLYATRGCADCHGEDLAGKVFIDAVPVMGRFIGANLTGVAGARTNKYTDLDFVRAIRNGVRPDGKSLMFMPSIEYNQLTDEDVGDLIAYIKSVDPKKSSLPERFVGPLARILYLTDNLPFLVVAENIDHTRQAKQSIKPEISIEYGKYLAAGCTGCHGDGLSGGKIPGGNPEWPPAANITPHAKTGIGSWSKNDFLKMVRSGLRPDGRQLNEAMPWSNLSKMDPIEIDALWAYLRSVKPKEFGNR